MITVNPEISCIQISCIRMVRISISKVYCTNIVLVVLWECSEWFSIVQYFARSMEQLSCTVCYVLHVQQTQPQWSDTKESTSTCTVCTCICFTCTANTINHNGQTQKNLLLHAETWQNRWLQSENTSHTTTEALHIQTTTVNRSQMKK